MAGKAFQVTLEIGGRVAASLGSSIARAQGQLNTLARATKTGFMGVVRNDAFQALAAASAAVGAGLIYSTKQAVAFESQLADIGKTAGSSAAELKALGADLLALSARDRTNQSASNLASGIQDLVAQGLELKDAIASIETLGRVATATNSNLTDITKTGFQLQNALKIKPTELKATFDALAYAGKQGAFELKDMAQFMPTIAAAAGSLGVTGREGAVSLAAMMQMVRRDAPDAGQAATRLTDAMLKMTAPDAVKRFKKFGVNIEQVLKDAKANGINPMEAAVETLFKVTGGDTFKLGQIFGDKEAKLALMSLMKYRAEYTKLRDDAGGSIAAGTVDADYQRSLGTFAEQMKALQNTGERLAISIGTALLPSLNSLANVVTPVIEGMARWAETNPGLMKGIVAIAGLTVGLTAALPLIGAVVAAIGVIGGPITLAVLGIGAAIALVIAYWDDLKQVALGFWGSVKQAGASDLFQGIRQGLTGVMTLLSEAKRFWVALFSGNEQEVAAAAQRIGQTIGAVILPAVAQVWLSIGRMAAMGVVALGRSFITGLAGAMRAMPGIVMGAARMAGTVLVTLMQAAIATVGSLLQQLPGIAGSAFAGITSQFRAVWDQALGVVRSFLPQMGAILFPLPTLVIGIFQKIVPGIASVFAQMVAQIQGAFQQVVAFIRSVPSMLAGVGEAIIQTIIDGVKAKAGELLATVQQSFARVRELMPFSDAKRGPFSTLTKSGMAIPGTLGIGVRRGAGLLRRPLVAAATAAMAAMGAVQAPAIAIAAPTLPQPLPALTQPAMGAPKTGPVLARQAVPLQTENAGSQQLVASISPAIALQVPAPAIATPAPISVPAPQIVSQPSIALPAPTIVAQASVATPEARFALTEVRIPEVNSTPTIAAPMPAPVVVSPAPRSDRRAPINITAPITINAGPGQDARSIAAQVRQVFDDLMREAELNQRAALND
ncbi:phage tail tape measure protein [Synechococcus elongatus]|uniref:Phage tail tape measure protein TP901, core region n=1 Tax=Synechococcus elongatus (strain ATCC 33912 / PCC 7942 / FACHB-805) TaxID=1140 RepID=Q31Q87_SYNE7|nr:phage tail tape measure protein [Synechococcus elongatus]ABB56782.1 Phage tail tape measure protein TP901, core region [Synechococcus elongatus PCC 7942 = FACHB-805]AJD58677.1 hypothetical protein M744_12985 [Synechococcus elongatus UTEX 2973]MBD2588647.1 phage tail tape measure protein [Synechococcus elongatus FACHB-242]MBD2689764.1 phage tail tape measure protein [Synechococcus elongatus FACHB-1061]MBD2708371.1 phage tail tape measure protein [Synechococcus elongatus PCC 7942 = FACHB-805]